MHTGTNISTGTNKRCGGNYVYSLHFIKKNMTEVSLRNWSSGFKVRKESIGNPLPNCSVLFRAAGACKRGARLCVSTCIKDVRLLPTFTGMSKGYLSGWHCSGSNWHHFGNICNCLGHWCKNIGRNVHSPGRVQRTRIGSTLPH